MLALPIFPVRLQTSIFGAGELNFRVRDGNGWTLTAINTNYGFFRPALLGSEKWVCASLIALAALARSLREMYFFTGEAREKIT